ncbi:MAG: hypothetical protein Q7S13_03365 [Candidatus Omnitrophota bacterium]|nr:hypothetical protein [Candidatus Omnitrophota bacterium]
MIKNPSKLNKFYKELKRQEKVSYREGLRIYEALYREAVALGRINSQNILDGIEVDIRLAKTLNALKES